MTWVTLFGICGGNANAVAGVLPDGRAAEVCRPIVGRREDGGAVPGVRDLPQDRLQDLHPVQGLWGGGTDRSVPKTLPSCPSAAFSDREGHCAAEAGAPQLGCS